MLDRVIAVVVGFGWFLCAQVATAQSGSDLLVELEGLTQASGSVYISVYNSEDDWLGENRVATRQLVIADARVDDLVKTTFNLTPGEYAISLYYDRNNNGKMDTNFIGIPKEPVAVSNNARARFGPPRYEDAVFSLGADPVVQRIAVKAID